MAKLELTVTHYSDGGIGTSLPPLAIDYDENTTTPMEALGQIALAMGIATELLSTLGG